MAKTKISEFSSTPGNNTDIDSINIAEGCAPSGINDAIRELMAQLKDFQTGAQGDSFNGPIGTTTAVAGAFTTLSASGTTTLSGLTASTALALDASKNVVSVTNTGTGNNVLATSPTLVTPILGTPTSVTLTNATGLPIATGVSGLGTGIATALAVNVGSAGAPVINGGALGTPSSGTVTNLTGTASININGTVGATTPTTGAFTTLTTSSTVTLNGGTANGVAYLNGSKVLTTGSVLTFDGTTFESSISGGTAFRATATTGTSNIRQQFVNTGGTFSVGLDSSSGAIFGAAYAGVMWHSGNYPLVFGVNNAEQMRLTYTGLGIGTSSPAAKLHARVVGSGSNLVSRFEVDNGVGSNNYLDILADSTNYFVTFKSTGAANGGFKFANASTTYATLDPSGNLGLGVTPSSTIWSGDETRLVVKGNGSSKAGVLVLQSQGTTNATTAVFVAEDLRAGASLGTITNSFLAFQTNGSERARIDTSGNLLVGTTSSSPAGTTSQFVNQWSGGAKWGISLDQTVSSATAYTHINFSTNGTTVGNINANNTATTYATSSDYRLKNITGPITTSGAYIDSLNPVEGTWKADGSTFVGLIAHEVQEASRTPVATGVKDGEEMQGMDYSSAEMIANMIAELKSLRARVAALEAA